MTIENAKRVYVEECAGSHSLGRLRKRWINTVKDCLKKRGLDDRQARIMVHDRSVWREFVKGKAWGFAQEMNPRLLRDATVVGCHTYMRPEGGNLSVAEAKLERHKGENLFLFSFLTSLLFCCTSFHGLMRADPAVAGGGDV